MDNLQIPFNFNVESIKDNELSLEGYKGFAGFHKYWGKKSTIVWRYLIENLTDHNDIVIDPFLGSGLIARECSMLSRRFIGFDINPISIELTKLYLRPPDYAELGKAISEIEKSVKDQINSMYVLSDGNIASHLLWNDDKISNVWTKQGRNRVELNLTKDELEKLRSMDIYQPKMFRELCLFDNSRINSDNTLTIAKLFTPRALRTIDLIKHEIEKHSGDLKRALSLILSASAGQMSNMVFAVSKRGKTKGIQSNKIEVGSWTVGYWCPTQHFEVNAWNCYAIKAEKLLKAISDAGKTKPVPISNAINDFLNRKDTVCVQLGDSEKLLKNIQANSVKVILTDPPHGDRIPYLELSEMWNSILGFDSNFSDELVVSNAKERGKDLNSYNKKLTSIFTQCARILKQEGFLAIMFNARIDCHWHSLSDLESSTELEYLGCYPIAYSAGSILQDNRKGGMKSDFVLLYGKQISEKTRLKTLETFKKLKGWTTYYPKEQN